MYLTLSHVSSWIHKISRLCDKKNLSDSQWTDGRTQGHYILIT